MTLATAIVGSMAVIVSFDPPLDAVLGLTGAVGGCSLVYVFPGLFYYKAVQMTKETKEARGGKGESEANELGTRYDIYSESTSTASLTPNPILPSSQPRCSWPLEGPASASPAQ